MSQMRTALRIYDILECICQLLASANSLDALSKLARTNSAFLEPALNALWHTIPSLEPLVRCLPDDAWSIRRTMYHHPVLTLKRKTTPQDWERCKLYAHRIRHYGMDDLDKLDDMKGATQTDKTFYVALRPMSDLDCKDNVPTPIPEPFLFLPNLQTCRLLPYTSDPIPHYSPFLSPTLTSLLLRIPLPLYVGDATIIGLLRSLPINSPNLRNLTLYGTVTDSIRQPGGSHSDAILGGEQINGLLTNALHGLRHLESLQCPYISFPIGAVRHLAGHMRLRALSIKNSAENILDALDHGPVRVEKEHAWFEYLEELSVECRELSDVTTMLKIVANMTKLKSLNVARTGGIPSETECRGFIKALADIMINTTSPVNSLPFHKCSATRVNRYLESLHIHQGDETGFLTPSERPTPVAKYTTTISTLSPLFNFPRLSELSIMVDTRFSLDDDDAQQMARAWPKLRLLELGFCGGGWGREGKTFTLEGLRIFAEHCPDLEELGVSISIDSVEPVERGGKLGGGEVSLNDGKGKSKGIHCQKLRDLELGDSVYLGEPERVARSLLDIFPKLSRVYGPSIAVSPEWERKWMQVSKIVHEIQGSGFVSVPSL